MASFPVLYYLHRKAEMMTGFNWQLFYSDLLLLSGLLSTGPLLYVYFVRKSDYFQENTMAGITHELKSPLAAIESVLEL
jgi:hypothetical protein